MNRKCIYEQYAFGMHHMYRTYTGLSSTCFIEGDVVGTSSKFHTCNALLMTFHIIIWINSDVKWMKYKYIEDFKYNSIEVQCSNHCMYCTAH